MQVRTAAAFHWNLGTLSYFFLFTKERLTMKQSAGGATVYGSMKDSHDALHEIEQIQAWLMDPVACPTTWATLLNSECCAVSPACLPSARLPLAACLPPATNAARRPPPIAHMTTVVTVADSLPGVLRASHQSGRRTPTLAARAFFPPSRRPRGDGSRSGGRQARRASLIAAPLAPCSRRAGAVAAV